MIHGVNYRATLPRCDRPAAGLRQPTPLINGDTGSNDGMLERARAAAAALPVDPPWIGVTCQCDTALLVQLPADSSC